MAEARSLPLRTRPARLHAAIAVLAGVLAALSVLVVTGAFDRLDRASVAGWMPGLDPSSATDTVPGASGIVVPFRLGTSTGEKALSLATYPASVFVSLVVFAAASVALRRRGERAAALAWAGLWLLGNGVEVALKAALAKPALYADEGGVTYHLAAFDHSFPSGHTTRAVLVAGAIGYVWPRLSLPAAAWAAAVPVLLVVDGAHVPSDVLGGLALGLLGVLATRAAIPVVEARASRRPPP